MEKLSVKQQGVKGGNPTWKEDVGYINAFINDKSILIDAFMGYGAGYRRRKTPQITINSGNKNYTFSSIDELFQVVENHFKKLQ